jgi:hypothetical protein
MSQSSTSTITPFHSRSSVGSCAPTRAGACESCSSKTTMPILRSSRYQTSRTERRRTIGADPGQLALGLFDAAPRVATGLVQLFPSCPRVNAPPSHQGRKIVRRNDGFSTIPGRCTLARTGRGRKPARGKCATFKWWPQRDSNPCFSLERAVSWASRRWGRLNATSTTRRQEYR